MDVNTARHEPEECRRGGGLLVPGTQTPPPPFPLPPSPFRCGRLCPRSEEPPMDKGDQKLVAGEGKGGGRGTEARRMRRRGGGGVAGSPCLPGLPSV